MTGLAHSEPIGPALVRDGSTVVCSSDDDAVLEVVGDVEARIELVRNAHPHIRCSGRSRVSIESGASTQPTIDVSERAEVRVVCTGSSSPTINLDGQATARVYARDESSPTLRSRGSSTYRLIVQDSAAPRVHDWPPTWVARRSEVYLGQPVHVFPDRGAAETAARDLVAEWRRCESRYVAALRTPGAIPMVCDDAVDFRSPDGTLHLELPSDPEGAAWCSWDAHDPHEITEQSRARCHKVWIEERP